MHFGILILTKILILFRCTWLHFLYQFLLLQYARAKSGTPVLLIFQLSQKFCFAGLHVCVCSQCHGELWVQNCSLYIQIEIKFELQKTPQKNQNQQKPPNQNPPNFESELKSCLHGNLIPRPNLAFNFHSFLTNTLTVLFLYLKEKEAGVKVRRKVS